MSGYTKLHKWSGKEGYERVISPENSVNQYMGLDYIKLAPGGSLSFESGGREMAMVLIEGDFSVDVDWKGGTPIRDATGSRRNPFDDMPYAVYIPPRSVVRLRSKNGMEARAYHIDEEEGNPPFFLEPALVEVGRPGVLGWQRTYRFLFGPRGAANDSVTKKLIVGESVSARGGWVGFPAHRHDISAPDEFPLDELFSFRVRSDRPGNGTIICYVFGRDAGQGSGPGYDARERWDDFYAIEDDRSAVSINEGYHTSLAVPGSQEYLFWGLGGKDKVYKLRFDPRHTWVFAGEQLM